jgi:hypothetical protein
LGRSPYEDVNELLGVRFRILNWDMPPHGSSLLIPCPLSQPTAATVCYF